jgi:uncharacterized membrane protein
MQDEPIGWDLTAIHPEPSTALKIYVLFSLLAILAAITRLVTLWIAAPPFRLSRQANNSAYSAQLSTASHSLKQWIGCALLAGGFVVCTDFYQACNHLLMAKTLNSTPILFAVRNSLPGLGLALLVALLLFLAQWHLLNRIEHLRKMIKSTAIASPGNWGQK